LPLAFLPFVNHNGVIAHVHHGASRLVRLAPGPRQGRHQQHSYAYGHPLHGSSPYDERNVQLESGARMCGVVYHAVLSFIPPLLWNSGPGHSEMPLDRTSSRLNKAESAAFFRRPIAYQLQSQVYRLQMRKDFAIVVPTVRAIEHEETRGKVANFRHENRLLTLGVIVDLELLAFPQFALRDLNLLTQLLEKLVCQFVIHAFEILRRWRKALKETFEVFVHRRLLVCIGGCRLAEPPSYYSEPCHCPAKPTTPRLAHRRFRHAFVLAPAPSPTR